MAKKLDVLVADLNRRLNAARFIGNTVVYERDTWDGLREALRKIVAYCVR